MRGVAVLFVGAGILMILMAVWFGGTASGGEGAEAAVADPGTLVDEGSSGFLAMPAAQEESAAATPAASASPSSSGRGSDAVPGALEAGGFLDVDLSEPVPEVVDAGAPPSEATAAGPAALAAPERTRPAGERASAEPLDPWAAVGTPSGADDVVAREMDVAAALAHGGGEGVLDHLTRVEPEGSEARRSLVLAFAAALLGNEQRSRELGQGLEQSGEVGRDELELLEAARIGRDALDLAAELDAREPMALAMRMALLERSGDVHLRNGRHALAARCFSELLLGELCAPWHEQREALQRWSRGIEGAQREHRWSRSGKWPAVDEVVQNGDSLVRIRKRVLKSHPDLLLCTGLIERANQLNGGYIHPNDELRIPVDRPSMIVDLSARWALYLLGDEVAAAWEVGIGKEGHETETGVFTVGEKKENPMWFRAGQPPVPFGDPENPLGTRWLAWHRDGVKTSLGFHGTSDPDGVGHRVSLGCIRMHNADVEELFEILPLGALVRVQP